MKTVPTGAIRPLRVCLVDMNNGHENQAMRCLRLIVSRFHQHVKTWNPGIDLQLVHVSPRDKGEAPPEDCDLYLSSGGPGSPYDGDGQRWVTDYNRFLDGIVEDNVGRGPRARALFGVCYSYEMIVRHFRLAEMVPRATRKFGVMPVYTTAAGRKHPLLAEFGDRLFAFEHRNWEAIGLDESQLEKLGGTLLALESREGQDDKGRAILGLDAAPGIETVQFHPEADRPGVVAWVSRPDQAAAFREAYGDETYERMLKTLDDPMRLARTFALLIPGWMVRKFNGMAPDRGWHPVGPPVHDMAAFGSEVRAQDLGTGPQGNAA
jgi:GMP synthase-like glutamine amidotransferase